MPPPTAVPQEFMDAAIQEINAACYYRADPEIEFEVDGDMISFISTSKIIPFNTTAKIARPKTRPAKGLMLIDEVYSIDGNTVQTGAELKNVAADRYRVRFKRKNSKIQEISDIHHWVSPVLAFKVTFSHDHTHACGVDILTGRSVGLASERTGTGVVYNYPCASFSGQGFKWWVKWQ